MEKRSIIQFFSQSKHIINPSFSRWNCCHATYQIRFLAQYSSKRPPPFRRSSPLPSPGPYKPQPPPQSPPHPLPSTQDQSVANPSTLPIDISDISFNPDEPSGFTSKDNNHDTSNSRQSRFSRLRFRNWPPSLRLFTETVLYTLGCTAIGIVIWDHVVQIIHVTGGSMTPTLNPDHAEMHTKRDVLLIRKFTPAVGLERGMLVTFPSIQNPDRVTVKRVIALPGDEVTTRQPCPKPRRFVDWNHVWVEGDTTNWKESRDSNWYGPISMSLITGRAVAVVGLKEGRWLKWEDWEKEADENPESIAAGQKMRVRREAVEVFDPEQF